jgi:hypothetical protein
MIICAILGVADIREEELLAAPARPFAGSTSVCQAEAVDPLVSVIAVALASYRMSKLDEGRMDVVYRVFDTH